MRKKRLPALLLALFFVLNSGVTALAAAGGGEEPPPGPAATAPVEEAPAEEPAAEPEQEEPDVPEEPAIPPEEELPQEDAPGAANTPPPPVADAPEENTPAPRQLDVGGSATARYASIAVMWQAQENALHYNLYRGTGEEMTLLAGELTQPAYTDATAAPDTYYTYRVDVVTAEETIEGTPFAANGPTGLAALQGTAAVHYAFEGEDRLFDGTRTVDKTADLPLVKDLASGTIVVKAKFTGGTGDMASTFRALLGLGNPEDDSTRQIVLGAAGNLPQFSTRYEFGKGLYSTAMRSTPFTDGRWHTLAFTAGDGYVSVSVDGQSGSTGADGYYTGAGWNGFFTRAQGLDSFTLGGFSSPNSRLYPYGNWIGEIAFVTITDEVLAPAVANQLTAALQNDIEITLSANVVEDPAAVGAAVGTIGFTGPGSEACVPALPAGEGDNALFALEGNVLKTAAALQPLREYTVVVAAGVAGVSNASFTIITKGQAAGPLLVIDEKTEVTAPLSYPALVEAAKGLADLTLTAQFVDGSGGIGSLFSLSRASAAADHFHVYVNGSTLGYEFRDAGLGANWHSSASVLRAGGLNTIAFKASSEDYTFKLFANGELVDTRQMDETTYKMVKDLAAAAGGIDAFTVGDTPRSGNNYPLRATVLGLQVHGTALSDEELLAYTAATPKDEDEEESPHIFEGSGAQYFRIPALYTLQDGAVMAALDARFGSAADSPNNLDTTTSFLAPGATQWSPATLPFHFDDFTDEPGYAGNSASFIDPVIVQGNDGVIHMMVDAFPGGFGYPNAATGSGMKTVDGVKYLALTKNGNSTTNWANFDHYIKDGTVYGPDNQPTEYTVDEQFCLYKNGEALYVPQRRPGGAESGKQVAMSIFYTNADFKLYGTSYLWIASSSDGGATWGAPRILNDLKREVDRFWGTGPGRGHVVQNGAYAGRLLLPTYDSQDGERASMIYSDDNGATWQRGERVTMASSNSPGKASEAQLVELPDGTIRVYARGNTGLIGYADSHDGGVSFEPMRQDAALVYGGNVMISVINYSGLVDGLPALVLASPEGGGRNNGVVRIGLIHENEAGSAEKYTVEWKYRYEVNKGAYVYSCLTELPDGRVALLYETNPNTVPCTYATYSIDELKQGKKSTVAAFALTNTEELQPGDEIEVLLQLKSKVVPALSSLESAVLNIAYGGLPAGQLAFSRFEEETNSLYFAGTLPQSEAGYSYRITVPENSGIFTLGGAFAPAPGDVVEGLVGAPANLAPLAALLEKWAGATGERYTPGSWAAFEKAYAAAQAVYGSQRPGQSEVDAACLALSQAGEALIPKPDKADLAGWIDRCLLLNEEDWTAESWAIFADVLQQARQVNADAEASQAQVDAALAALLEARFVTLQPGVSKKLLAETLVIARDTDTTGCTAGTIAALNKAIATAEAVMEDKNATSGEVNAAVVALLEAMVNLKDAGDKARLKLLLDVALQMDEQRYTPASWAPFDTARSAAQACYDDTEAGQREVDDAANALLAAMGGLQEAPDKSGLAALIAQAQKMVDNIGDYAPATVKDLAALLQEAKTVHGNPNAGKAAVQDMETRLMQAIAAARLKANKTALFNTLAFVNALNLDLYTSETAAPVQQAKAAAQTLLDDSNAKQEDVDRAVETLNRLYSLLQAKPTPPPANEGGNTPGGTASGTPPVQTAPPAAQPPAAEPEPATELPPLDADEAPKPEANTPAPDGPEAPAAQLPDAQAPQAAPEAPQQASAVPILVGVIVLLAAALVTMMVLYAKRRKNSGQEGK